MAAFLQGFQNLAGIVLVQLQTYKVLKTLQECQFKTTVNQKIKIFSTNRNSRFVFCFLYFTFDLSIKQRLWFINLE
jgi:hypothetical protein